MVCFPQTAPVAKTTFTLTIIIVFQNVHQASTPILPTQSAWIVLPPARRASVLHQCVLPVIQEPIFLITLVLANAPQLLTLLKTN